MCVCVSVNILSVESNSAWQCGVVSVCSRPEGFGGKLGHSSYVIKPFGRIAKSIFASLLSLKEVFGFPHWFPLPSSQKNRQIVEAKGLSFLFALSLPLSLTRLSFPR